MIEQFQKSIFEIPEMKFPGSCTRCGNAINDGDRWVLHIPSSYLADNGFTLLPGQPEIGCIACCPVQRVRLDSLTGTTSE